MTSQIPLNRQVMHKVSSDEIIAGDGAAGKPNEYASDDLCYLYFSVPVNKTAAGWNTIATLPSGYRPQQRIAFIAFDDTASKAITAVVQTNGQFQIWGITAGHTYWGGVTFARNPNS